MAAYVDFSYCTTRDYITVHRKENLVHYVIHFREKYWKFP